MDKLGGNYFHSASEALPSVPFDKKLIAQYKQSHLMKFQPTGEDPTGKYIRCGMEGDGAGSDFHADVKRILVEPFDLLIRNNDEGFVGTEESRKYFASFPFIFVTELLVHSFLGLTDDLHSVWAKDHPPLDSVTFRCWEDSYGFFVFGPGTMNSVLRETDPTKCTDGRSHRSGSDFWHIEEHMEDLNSASLSNRVDKVMGWVVEHKDLLPCTASEMWFERLYQIVTKMKYNTSKDATDHVLVKSHGMISLITGKAAKSVAEALFLLTKQVGKVAPYFTSESAKVWWDEKSGSSGIFATAFGEDPEPKPKADKRKGKRPAESSNELVPQDKTAKSSSGKVLLPYD